MKLLLLAFLVFLGFAIPDKSVSVKINVAPGPLRKVDRRDTLPHVVMGLNIREAPNRLTYDFQTLSPGVIVKNVEWWSLFGRKDGKYFGRINRVDEDGHVVQTLFSSQIKGSSMNVMVEHYGFYKIAVFREGDYCNGIEFDFRWFGKNDFTPIHLFTHHLILCE